MNSLKYTNGVLTVLAILLSLTLFTAWSGSAANPADSGLVGEAHANGIANAGAQRQGILDQLRLMNTKIDAVQAAISGGVTVRVAPVADAEGA